MDPYSIKKLDECLSQALQIEKLNKDSPFLPPSLSFFVAEIILNLSAVLTSEEKSIVRPLTCSCYRVHLKEGKASRHCSACIKAGFKIGSDLYKKVSDKVRAIAAYQTGWDGIGGSSFSPETIMLATSLCDFVSEEAEVIPCFDGSIEFQRTFTRSTDVLVQQINVLTSKNDPI